MNNSKIKILSVIVLLLFAGSLAMPLLTHINCDEDCCSLPVNTCEMDLARDDCCKTMKGCTLVPFQLIASAPLNKIDLQKDLTVDYNISFSENFNISEEYTFPEVIDKVCSSEVHTGFQTPLLV